MGRGKKVATDQIDPAARATLNQRMEEARADLGLRWRDVAEAAGLTTEGLRGVRNGPSGVPAFTRRQIERALKWPTGEVDRILDDSESAPPAQLTNEEMIAMNSEQLARHYITLIKTVGSDEAEDQMVHIFVVRRNARRSVAADPK